MRTDGADNGGRGMLFTPRTQAHTEGPHMREYIPIPQFSNFQKMYTFIRYETEFEVIN